MTKPLTGIPEYDTPRRGILEQLKFLTPYWVSSDEKWKARWMLGGIIALTLAEIALTAGMGLGFQAVLNAMVAKDMATFVFTGALTIGAMVTSGLCSTTRDYVKQNLAQNWRGWLTKEFNSAWLSGKSYLRMQYSKQFGQTPDQRIGETITNVAMTSLGLGLGLFRSVVGVATFSTILWSISPVMVFAAAGCAVGASALTLWTGGSMDKIWRGMMNLEARFRQSLSRVRDNAKPIALAGLEPVEKETLAEKFNEVDAKRREFYKQNWRVSLVGSLNMSGASVVPIALSAPAFFAGKATLGGLEFARQIYMQFYNALSWFPQGYTEIAGLSANITQLMEFEKDIRDNRADITGQVSAAPKPATPAPALAPAVAGVKP